MKDIRYDAKGQRQRIVYGNNTVTRYTYDPLTYRLRSQLTTANTGTVKRQELFYTYDPVGNITRIEDGVQPAIYYNNTLVQALQTFTYDALYRLIQATGRELDTGGSPAFAGEDNWNDASAAAPPGSNAARNYTQSYTYDAVGNILSLQHSAGAGSYTRQFSYAYGHNRLVSTSVTAGTTHSFTTFPHDARGNMTAMPHLDALWWNALNELHALERGSLQAYYQYSGGQRVRKWVDKGSVKEERVYLGGFEIYRKFNGSSLKTVERTTIHVQDDTGRIAMLESRTYGTVSDDNNTAADLVRYIYSNHLQSASLELDENAEIISYEEYHPYGTSAYQAKSATIDAVAKRYRYTGKERDEESGLYYHGVRYYIPWLCRWTASDPLESKYAGVSPYNYSFNNPVMFNDLSGMEPGDPPTDPPKEKEGGWYNQNGKMKFFEGDLFGKDFKGSGIKGEFQGEVWGADGKHYRTNGTIEKVPIYSSGAGTLTHKPEVQKASVAPANAPTAATPTSPDSSYSMIPQYVRPTDFWSNVAFGAEDAWKSGVTGFENFARSLGTKKGWSDLGSSIGVFFKMMNPYSSTKEGDALWSGVENYIRSIPGKSKSEMGHDLGYGGMTILSSLLLKSPEAKAADITESALGKKIYIPETPLAQQEVRGIDIPLPDPAAGGYPHTTLGGKAGSNGVTYRQSATFTDGTWPKANGQNVPWSRVDWSDHGTPWHHPYNPHQHIFNYDFKNRMWRFGPGTPFPY